MLSIYLSVCLYVCLALCLCICLLSVWRNEGWSLHHFMCTSRCTADWFSLWPLTQIVHDQIISLMQFTCVWPIWACLTISNPPSAHLFSSCRHHLLLLPCCFFFSRCHPVPVSLSGPNRNMVSAVVLQGSRGQRWAILYLTSASIFDAVARLAVSKEALSLSLIWHADTLMHILQWEPPIDCIHSLTPDPNPNPLQSSLRQFLWFHFGIMCME